MKRTLSGRLAAVKAQSCGWFWHNCKLVHRPGRFAELVPAGATAAKPVHPHGPPVFKSLSANRKNPLSTEKGSLYYYDYLDIEVIEEETAGSFFTFPPGRAPQKPPAHGFKIAPNQD
ncbi:MAG: hypothetical protein IAE92_12210 [Burkholderiaceae bacterium]|nr:hypothetical protein [Burkholderiaceae bacterium]